MAPAKKSGAKKKPAKEPKAPKQPKPSKAEKAAEKLQQQASAANAAIGSNSADPNTVALFQHHLKKIRPIVDRIKSLNGDVGALYKVAKGDGFTKEQIKLALSLKNADGSDNAEGIEKFRDKQRAFGSTLILIGSKLVGEQFDMFKAAPDAPKDEKDALKLAYEAGVNCSKAENPCKTTDYAPGSPQLAEFIRGYQDDQAERLKGGIKTLKPEEVTSGQPMTRAQFRAQREAAEKAAGETAH